jgi:glycosyltransferase involved in cell wall biosynthesis
VARGLVGRGYRVRIIGLHPRFDTLSERRFVRDGIEVWYVGQMHVRKAGSVKEYFDPLSLAKVAVSAAARLTETAIKNPSDVYHVWKPHPMNGLAGLALLAAGRRVYLDCDDFEAASNRFGAEWQRRVVGWFEDILPRLVHGVTVNTRFLEERVSSLTRGRQDVTFVPNAADPDRFRVTRDDAVSAFRSQQGLESNPVVAYIGSMELASHPVDLLLESFARVLEDVPDAILLLVGGGADLPALRRRAADLEIDRSTRLVGRVPVGDVSMYYAAADVSVDPVRNDLTARARSPLKVYESLAVGTPVVTGDVGDRRSILAENCEMLVEPGSADALARGVSTFLRDEALRRRVRNWALENRARFCWPSRIDTFAQLYE